jgi:hypothetical protein
LSFAGQSLISAADALKGAAAAMNPFAALPRTLPPWLLGGAAATGAYFWSTRGAGGPSNMPELEQLNRAMQELEDSTKHVSAVQGELAKATDPEVIKRLNAELRQAQERQAAAKEQVAKTGAEANIPPLGPPAPDFHELPPTQAEYERALQWEKEEREAERRRAEIQRRTRGRQDTTLPPPSQIPLPRERPSFAPPVPPVAPLDLPPSLTLPSTTELEKSSRPTDLINLTSVDEASARFEAAFGTGSANITSAADSLSAAGAAAASIIASGASAAGSAYGAAAAAQISAAAANVHINVTQSGGRPDPGAQKTD